MQDFRFRPEVEMKDVESAILLSTLAAEAVHGRAQVRLHARYRLDPESRRLHCNTDTPVGDTLASVFTLLAGKMLGEDAFVIEQPTVLNVDHGGCHGN